MGASFFKTTYRGKSMSDAYSSAVSDAESEYGHDPYNGTISTTDGCSDMTSDYKNSGKSLPDYIDSWVERGRKRQCLAICLEPPRTNTNKIKSHIEHFVSKGTKKWILKYVVYCYESKVGAYDTKGEAVKAARAHTEKYLSSTSIIMEKSIDKGNAQVARVTYKRSDKEKDGKWIFFGWAAE
jgi:hypothetical protein